MFAPYIDSWPRLEHQLEVILHNWKREHCSTYPPRTGYLLIISGKRDEHASPHHLHRHVAHVPADWCQNSLSTLLRIFWPPLQSLRPTLTLLSPKLYASTVCWCQSGEVRLSQGITYLAKWSSGIPVQQGRSFCFQSVPLRFQDLVAVSLTVIRGSPQENKPTVLKNEGRMKKTSRSWSSKTRQQNQRSNQLLAWI